jgi:hypothetical protein
MSEEMPQKEKKEKDEHLSSQREEQEEVIPFNLHKFQDTYISISKCFKEVADISASRREARLPGELQGNLAVLVNDSGIMIGMMKFLKGWAEQRQAIEAEKNLKQ